MFKSNPDALALMLICLFALPVMQRVAVKRGVSVRMHRTVASLKQCLTHPRFIKRRPIV